MLVVDDDPAVLELLTSILRREGRSVVGSYDGRTALDEMNRAPYDLMVAGHGRNGMDGLELLRRSSLEHPRTPVILTSEKCEPEHVVRAMREHAYSYFHKPLPPGALADMVNQALTSDGWEGDIEMVTASPFWLTANVRCKLDTGERMAQFLREAIVDIPGQVRDDIVGAFRELLMNAIEHGGRSDVNKTARVTVVRTRKSFMGYIGDPGAGFSLDALSHAAISNPAGAPTRHVEVRAEQGQRPGGFGILMARNMVDELVYNERGNEVVFVKYLS